MAIRRFQRDTTVVHRDDPDMVEEPIVTTRVTDDLPEQTRSFAIVYYILNILEALLLIRFALMLLGANPGAGFTSMIYAITNPLVAPFRGIFPAQASSGAVLEWSTIIAMIVYALIAYAIVQLLRIASNRSHAV